MFSRNKKSNKASVAKPPVRPMPKNEPVLSGSAPIVKAAEPPVDKLEPSPRAVEPAPAAKPMAPPPAKASAAATPTPEIVAEPVPGESTLTNQVTIVGNVTTSGSLHLNSEVRGDIRAKELVIGPDALIKGTIRAEHLSLSGQVDGKIIARNVSLTQTARMNGDVVHHSLSIESGAELNGAVRRSDEPLDSDGSLDDPAPAIELRQAPTSSGGDDDELPKVDDAVIIEAKPVNIAVQNATDS